jgi:ribulose-phosphate 3-epimerase
MLSSKIIPAIIPTSSEAIFGFTKKLHGVPEIHLDVVDGRFVPFVSWPYTPVGEPQEVAADLARFTLEVDLMVENPFTAATAWVAAGADLLVFHAETATLAVVQQITETCDVTVGICANNDTPHEVLVPYLEHVDYVQIMGIAKIGSQGQPFDERAFERLLYIRTIAPQLLCSIDGSVNATTLARIKQEGFDRYIVGSAIYGAADPRLTYMEFSDFISSTGETFPQ